MRRRDFIRAIVAAAWAWPIAAGAQGLSIAADHHGGAVRRGRRVRRDGPDRRGPHERDPGPAGAGREYDRAAGIIGVNRVANAAPDGYTFLLGSIGTHAYNQTIYKKPRYDAVADFAPVALFAEQPMVLDARKDLPAGSLPEFIAYAKANSAKMQFGSAGAGTTTHLGCVLLNAAIGVNVTHVPYRGGGPAANDLIGGQIDYMCANIGGAVPLILGKQVKAIATLTRDRSPILPDLATAHEQGLIDFDVNTGTPFFLPKGTPAAIVRKLSEATSQAMDSPAVQSRLRDIGVTGVAPERRSPEYLAKFVVDEIARWAVPIKAHGLQLD